jgi:uncharacterized protein (DUF1501 family)
MISRRDFLGRSSAGVSFLALSGTMPRLFAEAAVSAKRAGRSDRVLVVVELAGGNDGLNTAIPFENDLYYKNRPTLGVPKDQVLRLNEYVGLHPAMGPMSELFKEGKLTVVQGVGYPEPDRSHFRSMEIWHTASTSKKVPLSGWLGRIIDAQPPTRSVSESSTTPTRNVSEGAAGSSFEQAIDLPALAFTGSLPQALQSEHFAVPVIQQIENFASAAGEGQAKERLLKKLSTAPGANSTQVGFVRQQAEMVYRTAERLRDAAAKYKSDVMYPGELGAQLRRAAQVIAADLGVRLMYVQQGGYDTHSNQAAGHPGLLGELAGALAAFQNDLEQLKVADKVVVMVFSEFGRRVDENASKGTDHGAASCMFLTGSKVKGGLEGSYPQLDKLGDGDLIHTVDFRSVYATVIDGWLGCSSEKLLGEKFGALELLTGS